jgi:glycosyltransferase involved in cell wall biosynthesis
VAFGASTIESLPAKAVAGDRDGQVHVLHVVPGLLPGGMELGMAKVISGLCDGMKHSIACLKEEPQIAHRLPAEVDIHCLHARSNELGLPLRLARLIRQVHPTVIHARNWGAWPDTIAAALLVRPRVPVILSFHGLGKAGYMPWRRRMASRVLARMASGLFTVSQASKDLMVERWGWPERKVQVIPNGVDTERFVPAEHQRTSGRMVIGTVGNLRPVKNHALLVEACADLVRRGHDLEIRIAGEGEERPQLLALAESLGLADRLKLMGSIEDVPAFLNELHIFALTSDSEQHPNALNEAMACGLPCVSTRVGCVDELLDDGRSGKIVPPGDREALAGALDSLIADEGLRSKFATLARERACEAYSLANMLSAYRRLYEQFSLVATR